MNYGYNGINQSTKTELKVIAEQAKLSNPQSNSLPQDLPFLKTNEQLESLSHFDEQILSRLLVKRGSSVRTETL